MAPDIDAAEIKRKRAFPTGSEDGRGKKQKGK